MPVPLPSLQLTVTAPNGTTHDYTQYLAYSGCQQQMMITQNFGRQGDTAVITLQAEHDGTSWPVRVDPMSQVRLRDRRAGQTLFAGIVTNPAVAPRGVNLVEWDLNCTDYTFYADKAIVRYPSSLQVPSDQVVVALTSGAACGISAATVADGGYVAPGPFLPDFSLGYTTLSGAWRTMAAQMGQVVPYGWYVDESRQLHFYNQDTALNSGVTFTTRPTTAGSTTEGHVLLDEMFAFEQDGTSLSNQILVQGANQQILPNLDGAPTSQWVSNGYDTSWPLQWTVASGSSVVSSSAYSSSRAPQPGQVPAAVLYVGGVLTDVVKGRSGEAPTAPWSIVANSAQGYFLVALEPPPPGTTIQIWYAYLAPIIVRATDQQSVATYRGPNGGVYAEYVSDTSLITAAEALARAQQVRSEYAFPVQRVTFDTSPDFTGWVRAGWSFGLECDLLEDPDNGYAMGLSGQFLCISNQITFTRGGYRTCMITGVRI